MKVPNHHTANTIQSNWYQTLRKSKGNRWMWKPDTTQNMKLATKEITRGDTLISLIKGFLLGGRQIPKLWPQRILTAIFSQTHKHQRPIHYTFAPKPISYDERKEKSMGILWMTIKMRKRTQMNKDKTGWQLHWGNNIT